MEQDYYRKYEPFFGSWRIVKKIGQGNFASVFEIERDSFDMKSRSAMKAIHIPGNDWEIDAAISEGMDEAAVEQYFYGMVTDMTQELKMMSELKGVTNIVSYEDHTVIRSEERIGWDILIRMELLTPLKEYARTHVFNEAEVIKLGIDICRALELCDAHNIIHRDVKMENIFVSQNGAYKLGDFGIARTLDSSKYGLSIKGTYSYMAPEVYKGDPYDAGVDIYSLGIVLYRMMNNGRSPFLPEYPETISADDSANAFVRRMKGEALPKPCNASNAMSKIILKACAYDPSKRFDSPSAMRKSLENLAAQTAGSGRKAKTRLNASDKRFGGNSSRKRKSGIKAGAEEKKGKRMPRRIFAAIIAVLIAASALLFFRQENKMNVPDNAFQFNGHYYYIYDRTGQVTSWEEAREFCRSKGGYLATLTTEEENLAVFNEMVKQGYENSYFGLYESENGRWHWVSGEIFNYSSWAPGEPNSDEEPYARFTAASGTALWNDDNFRDKSGQYSFICEWGRPMD